MGGESIFPGTTSSCLLFGRGALTHYQKRTKTMSSEPLGGENFILPPFFSFTSSSPPFIWVGLGSNYIVRPGLELTLNNPPASTP